MLSTLKDAVMSIKNVQPEKKPKGNISDGLLGKYAGIVPEDKHPQSSSGNSGLRLTAK